MSNAVAGVAVVVELVTGAWKASTEGVGGRWDRAEGWGATSPPLRRRGVDNAMASECIHVTE